MCRVVKVLDGACEFACMEGGCSVFVCGRSVCGWYVVCGSVVRKPV